MADAVPQNRQTLGFQTEVKELLHLMVHSLYSNKEIFLRELISNAADAIDKLRFASIGNDRLYAGDANLKVRVEGDSKERTITVSDNGIGMSREEIIQNLGTIARSGTRQFLAQLKPEDAKDARLIGQFGVGFYSSFIVADRVTVISRRAGLPESEAVRWDSDGTGEFTVETVTKAARGTVVTLHLKEGENDLLSPDRLREIIHRYSEHVPHPIEMNAEDEKKEPRFEVVNQARALWTRSKSDIKQDDYDAFYKSLTHDFEEPLVTVHHRIEGNLEYTLLLYVPKRPPFDMLFQEKGHGVKLYVRRVFIMDETEKLMPKYLRFVRGVIDSNDLPLNVSREILQDNRIVDTIRTSSVKKILSAIEDLAVSDKEKFATFWQAFGTILKEGVVEDATNRERILKLLRFASTFDGKETPAVSLTDYILRMKPGQEHVYYIIADSFAAARGSAQIEILKKKGVEVLLLWERVDHWVMAQLTEFEGKKLKNVAKGDLELGMLEEASDREEKEKAKGTYNRLLEHMQGLLAEQVKEVRISSRLTDSPACLVTDEHDLDRRVQRILEQAGQKIPPTKAVLEINPQHFIVRRLSNEDNDQRFADWTQLLYDQAVLSDGGQLTDPAAFVGRLNDLLMSLALSSY